MKTTTLLRLLLCAAPVLQARGGDPRTNSWLTAWSGQYARIYTTDQARLNGQSVTTWSDGSTVQSLPAYCGVQEVYSSSNWVYVRSTGLGSHVMGAWYLDAAHTMQFPAFPVNQKVLYQIPRVPVVPSIKSESGGGAVGLFVDGVAMFNNWDAFYWNGTTDVSTTGAKGGYWNRDAFVNEGVTFDPAYAHQPGSGQYHYHANPIALRYLLGDHVDFNSAAKTYSESTSPPARHSPILGWAADGFPIYGPYGYSVSNDAGSGIRRMLSGFVIRNGQYGTSNLTLHGRTTIPAWAARLYNVASNAFAGPNVSASYPLGRYIEDNDYLGDHGYRQGVDFDLDEYNCRWCATPEFPGGTYAYFVAIASDGTPVFPYNIGLGYYGSPTGGSVGYIGETVATNFLGGTNLVANLNKPLVNPATVTLTWSAVEGGSYQVQVSNNLLDWSTRASGISPNRITGSYTNTTAADHGFYRVARTSVASFDSAGTTVVSGGILSVSPANAAAGTMFTLTVNIDPAVSPPPVAAPVNSVTVGNILGTSDAHASQTQVTSSITIPPGTAAGLQTVTLVFPGPPMNPSATVTYTLPNGFTVN